MEAYNKGDMNVYCKKKGSIIRKSFSRDIHKGKREEMIQIGLTSGLNSTETIHVYSHELDKLILQYQCYKEKQTPKMVINYKGTYFSNCMKENQVIFGECL